VNSSPLPRSPIDLAPAAADSGPLLRRVAGPAEARLHWELLGPGGQIAMAEQAAQYAAEICGDGRAEYTHLSALLAEASELANAHALAA
jgi:hypothetical protein